MTPTVFVCTNRRLGTTGSCGASGAHDLATRLKAELKRRNLTWQVAESPCMGHCGAGPNVKAAPGGPLLHRCRAADVAAIVDRLFSEWIP